MISITETIIKSVKKFGLKYDGSNLSAAEFILSENIIKSFGTDEFNEDEVNIVYLAGGFLFEISSGEKISVLINNCGIEVRGFDFNFIIDFNNDYLYSKFTSKNDSEIVEDYYILEDDVFTIARRVNDDVLYNVCAQYAGLVTPEFSIYSIKQRYPKVKSNNIIDSIKSFYAGYTLIPVSKNGQTKESYAQLNKALLKKSNNKKEKVL